MKLFQQGMALLLSCSLMLGDVRDRYAQAPPVQALQQNPQQLQQLVAPIALYPDGLVAQIPALVISSAAGIIVSRVTTGDDVGNQIVSQRAIFPKAWWLASGIVGLFGLVPGMPHLPFLAFSGLLGVCRESSQRLRGAWSFRGHLPPAYDKTAPQNENDPRRR